MNVATGILAADRWHILAMPIGLIVAGAIGVYVISKWRRKP
jgi:hypothetical protein